jgi:ribosomal protein S12 methylthiotransferase
VSRAARPRRSTAVYLDTLGCEKNVVDSEAALGLLLQRGFTLVGSPRVADLVVVNTCGFLAVSRAESLDRIRELATQKNGGKLVVMGCFVQGGTHDIQRLVPEVDAVLGVGQYHRLAELFDTAAAGEPARAADVAMAGVPDAALAPYMGLEVRATLTPRHVAYLKIAEGCNQPCTFCKIPLLRGRQRSFPLQGLVAQARGLVERGAQELILIAQNSSSWGIDLADRPRLPQLCGALSELDGLRWIRVMYAFPALFTDALAEELYALPKVTSYLDIPIQHASPAVLERMRRGYDPARLRRQVQRLRTLRPDIMLRTTALVGFPGETEEDVAQLLDFLAEIGFDHVGTFVYSHEEGTASHAFEDDVDPQDKEDRARRVIDLQWDVALERKQAMLGRTMEVVVDEVHPGARDSGVLDVPIEVGEDLRTRWNGPVAFARSAGFCYDVDGGLWLAGDGLSAGDRVDVRPIACGPYDLLARRLGGDPVAHCRPSAGAIARGRRSGRSGKP